MTKMNARLSIQKETVHRVNAFAAQLTVETGRKVTQDEAIHLLLEAWDDLQARKRRDQWTPPAATR